jgi:hypothetical protein
VGVPVTFTLPEAGKVTIQIRNSADEVVANPVAEQMFEAGEHTIYWNLEDIDGNTVLNPGKYSWRGLRVPGLGVEYKFSYYPTPLPGVPWTTPSRTGGWLADHEPPRTIVRGYDDTMWLGAFAEGGSSILHMNAKAEKLWGINRIWVAIPTEICTDGDYYYGFCEGAWIKDAQVIIQVDQRTKADKKIFQRPIKLADKEGLEQVAHNLFISMGPTGFQVVGNRGFVSFGKSDLIEVFDMTKGQESPQRNFGWNHAYTQFDEQKPVLLREISLPSPGRLRKFGKDKLITTSGRDVVTIDLNTYAVETLFADRLENPLGLSVHPDGDIIYIGEGEPKHQVFGFDLDGNIVATIGKPGRRQIGPFDYHDMEEPYGVEVAVDGTIWVAEHTHFPKRLSVWDPETGKCIRHVLGPTPYGGGGSIDPEGENRLFHRGLEFRRNPDTGEVTFVNLIYRPDAPEFARFSDNDYPCYAFRTPDPLGKGDSRLWFTSHMWAHWHNCLVLWEYKTDHVQPVAALGSATALRQVFGETPLKKNDREDRQDTSALERHIPGYNQDEKFFTWTDLNDDGFVQPSELKFGKLEDDEGLLTEASANWHWRMNSSFETAANAGEPKQRAGLTGETRRIVRFKPHGFSAHGYPLYNVPTDTLPECPGSCTSFMPDSSGNIIQLLSSTTPEGRLRWRYRNEWPTLHAGHRTTARGDEPGVVIAPLRTWGIVPVNDEIGEVIAFTSNLGCIYFMTADDGLFIGRVFRDARLGLVWNSETPPTPEVFAEMSLGAEHFGGTLQKVRCADGKYRYLFVAGKNHCSVIELTGLDTVRRIPGGTITVTRDQIMEVEAERLRRAGQKTLPKTLHVPRVANDSIKVDGNAAEWSAGRTEGFALAYDDTHIHVLYQGKDAQATFQNNGVNPLELFKTGDVIDVMLQTNPKANPRRDKAAAGDIRISFSMFEGKPVCVLYDFVIPDYKGPKIPFSSPWRTVWCDRVVMLEDAKVQVQRRGEYYTLEASVPLEDIGLDPKKLRSTRGDVGRVMSDASATEAVERVYWSNKNTAITADLPSEAGLQPRLWGTFIFE